jgi:hypothetical protein
MMSDYDRRLYGCSRLSLCVCSRLTAFGLVPAAVAQLVEGFCCGFKIAAVLQFRELGERAVAFALFEPPPVAGEDQEVSIRP